MAFYSDLNYLKPNKGPIIEDLQDIYQAIYSLLATKPGQRLFRPTWGGDLSRYLFEPCDEMTARSMLYDINVTLAEDPRITLDQSQTFVTPDPVNSQFLIQIKLDTPGYSDYERTINLTFKQGNK